MNNKRLLLLLTTAIVLSAFTACEQAEDPLSTDEETGDNASNHEDSTDYIWDASAVIPILLKGTSIAVEHAGATVDGSKVTITTAETYSFSGTLSDGQIIVNTPDKETVRLILGGASINNTTSAAVNISRAKKVIMILADQTENFITDGKTYSSAGSSDDAPNASVFSMSDLTICGTGSLTVTGNYKDGITSKDGLILKSGTIDVTSVDDGIRGKDYLVVKAGNITVKAGGDGLKSDNDTETDLGFILAGSGNISVTSGGDAIAATTDVIITGGTFNLTNGGGSSKPVSGTLSAKGIKAGVVLILDSGTFDINSADDALHSNGKLAINGGSLTLSSGDDGIHAETSVETGSCDLTIAKSVEGIEGPFITVTGGNIRIIASDDGFNATHGVRGEFNDGSFLYLHGGNISVNTSRGDGLDSNGSIEMTAGTVIVHGPQSQPEVGTDYNGTLNISGGFLIISGTNSNMTQGTSPTSAQYGVRVTLRSGLAAGTIFRIEDAGGNDMVTFKPARTYSSIVFSSPGLKNGSTYSIFTGGSATGTVKDGLVTGGSFSGGILKKSFTLTSKVVSISL